jgi:hypothetical protein
VVIGRGRYIDRDIRRPLYYSRFGYDGTFIERRLLADSLPDLRRHADCGVAIRAANGDFIVSTHCTFVSEEEESTYSTLLIRIDSLGNSVAFPEGVSENPFLPQKINGLSAFPNPFNGSCMIEAEKEALVEIYNLKGQLIESKYGSFSFSPSENESSGIYLVKSKGTDNKTSSKKVFYMK